MRRLARLRALLPFALAACLVLGGYAGGSALIARAALQTQNTPQQNVYTGIIVAAGAPSGTCVGNSLYVNSSTNAVSYCNAGTWTSTGGSSGVTSITFSPPLTGGTITSSGSAGLGTLATGSNGLLNYAFLPNELIYDNSTGVTDATTGAQNLASVTAANSGDMNVATRHIHVHGGGVATTTSATEAITGSVQLGGTTVWSAAQAFASSKTNLFWWFDIDIYITANGSTGTVITEGCFHAPNNLSTSVAVCQPRTSTASVNVTGTPAIQFVANWTNASNSITQNFLYADYFN